MRHVVLPAFAMCAALLSGAQAPAPPLPPLSLVGAVAPDGGVPIVVNGKTIGAIGVSGGADDAISQAGAEGGS